VGWSACKSIFKSECESLFLSVVGVMMLGPDCVVFVYLPVFVVLCLKKLAAWRNASVWFLFGKHLPYSFLS
jgi:hypothetical protein